MSVIELPDDPDGFRRQGGLYVPWPRFIADFRQAWRPGEHLTVLGRNWSGKTWLIRHLLEARWAPNRVYFIDTKAAKEPWQVGFRTVHGMPNWLEKQAQRWRGGRQWLRIVPPATRAEGRRVVGAFMNSAWRRGSTVVVLDELRGIAGRPPNLNLGEAAHVLWQRGRAKGISVVGGAQSPVYIPRAALEEQSYLFIGHIADSRRLPVLRDVVGDRGNELVELVRQIEPHTYRFVYVPQAGALQVIQAPATMPGAKAATGGEWTRSRRFRALYGD